MSEMGRPEVLTVPLAGTLRLPLNVGRSKFEAGQPAGGDGIVGERFCTVMGTERLL